MRNYYESEHNSDKIPYDKEPIIRQTNYKKSKPSSSKPSKALSLIVCVLVVFNIILSCLVISSLKDDGPQINNTTVNINSEVNTDVAAVSTKAEQSIVCVHAGLTIGSSSNPNYQGFYNMSSKGAGVIIEDDKNAGDAYIVTCYHVVKSYLSEIYVLLYDSFKPIKAQLIKYSSIYDIAVIKIEGSSIYSSSYSTPATIADSSMLLKGDGAVAIGNPLGSGIGITSGKISKTTDLVKIDNTMHRVLRTDAAINGGNSGGGLFNMSGELIGIVNAKATDNPSANSYIDNVAYAIPSNVAISLAYNIIRNTNPVKPSLGFSLLVSDPSDQPGIKYDIINGRYIPVQTVVVSEVISGSSAAKAECVNNKSLKGLDIDDVLVGFKYGETLVNVTDLYSFDDHAFNINRGDKITLFIERDGVSLEFVVTVENVVSADARDWYGED